MTDAIIEADAVSAECVDACLALIDGCSGTSSGSAAPPLVAAGQRNEHFENHLCASEWAMLADIRIATANKVRHFLYCLSFVALLYLVFKIMYLFIWIL